jgi:hypothetical protein
MGLVRLHDKRRLGGQSKPTKPTHHIVTLLAFMILCVLWKCRSLDLGRGLLPVIISFSICLITIVVMSEYKNHSLLRGSRRRRERERARRRFA